MVKEHLQVYARMKPQDNNAQSYNFSYLDCPFLCFRTIPLSCKYREQSYQMLRIAMRLNSIISFLLIHLKMIFSRVLLGQLLIAVWMATMALFLLMVKQVQVKLLQ